MTRPAIRALIVDDEALARQNLRHAVAGQSGWVVVGECAGVAEAVACLDHTPVDVVFLDVQMPRVNGLALARTLSATDAPPIIIFVTAFERFAVDAFELHALDYLLKPFDDQRFAQAARRAAALVGLRERAAYASALRGYMADVGGASGAPSPFLQRLSIRSVGRLESILVSQVRWIGAAGNYVELHLPDRVVLHRVALAHLEQRLDPRDFFRVHRRTLVRRRECAVLSVVGDGVYELTLHGGEVVAVSERHVDAVRQVLTHSR
jgi:DNA-binding LytR/AlgR family response regulator